MFWKVSNGKVLCTMQCKMERPPLLNTASGYILRMCIAIVLLLQWAQACEGEAAGECHVATARRSAVARSA